MFVLLSVGLALFLPVNCFASLASLSLLRVELSTTESKVNELVKQQLLLTATVPE